jgi:AraC family transcriptional regulator of adaptative response / DNA-3-methyladenine glycosylase II
VSSSTDSTPGLIEVSPGDQGCLLLRAHLPYWEGLIHVVDRVGRVLGIDADHAVGVRTVSEDPVLGPLAASRPGLVVPAAWNPFEAGVWAILSGGQPGLPGRLTHTFPDPAKVTRASLASIGLPDPEVTTIAALAETLASDEGTNAGPDQLRPWLALAAAHLMETVLT